MPRTVWWPLLGMAVALVGATGCKRSQAMEETPSARGRELFRNVCSRCHGAEGTGGLAIYPGAPTPRNFHDHAFQSSHTDEQIKQTIINGKPPGMPPFGTMFDDKDLAAIIKYVRSLDPGH